MLIVEAHMMDGDCSKDMSATIEFIDDDPVLLGIVDLFFQQFPDQYSLLEDTFRHRDWREFTRLAHSLKGASLNLRFSMISAEAKHLENAAKNQDADAVPRLLETLCKVQHSIFVEWQQVRPTIVFTPEDPLKGSGSV